MADIINTVGPGQTYTTIESWWAAKPNTTDVWVGHYVGTGTISVAALSDTNPNGGARLEAQTPYNFDSPTDAHITISSAVGGSLYARATDPFTLEGFEVISLSTADDLDNPIRVDAFANQLLTFIKCRLIGGESIFKGRNNAGASYTFINCHCSGSAKMGLWPSNTASFSTSHCVVEGCNTGASLGHGGIYQRVGNTHDSTVAYGNGSEDWEVTSGIEATKNFCASGDSSATGTGAVTGVTTADFDDTGSDIWTSKVGGLLSGTGSGGTDIGFNLIAASVVLILTPTESTLLGRNKVTNKQDIVITGTYSGPTVPTGIEASFNGGGFTTIDASPGGGTYSGTLSAQDVGNGDLVIRYTNDNSVTMTQANVAIGAKFLVWGQSNFSGRATNAQTYTATAGLFHKYTVTNNTWEIGADPFDTATNSGSVFPLIANHLVNNKNIPIAFIGVAQGSTSLSQWQTGQTYNTRMLDYLANSGGNDVEGIISWIGETDSSLGTLEATFKSEYNAIIDQLETQTGIKSVLCGIAQAGGEDVNTWIQDIVASNANALNYVDIAALFTGVHYETDQETSDSALAIYNQINLAFFSSILNLTISGIPDGSFMTVLDQADGTRIQRQNETYTSEALSISIPVDAGTTVKGYVDDATNPSSDAAYIEGITI